MARIDGQGSNWIRRSTRLAIYHRDGDACVYCGRKVKPGRGTNGGAANTAHLDHLHPCELGGRSTADNLVTACGTCNSLKGTKSLRAFLTDLAARRCGVKNPTAAQVRKVQRDLAARIRKLTATPLDRAEGRARAAAGK